MPCGIHDSNKINEQLLTQHRTQSSQILYKTVRDLYQEVHRSLPHRGRLFTFCKGPGYGWGAFFSTLSKYSTCCIGNSKYSFKLVKVLFVLLWCELSYFITLFFRSKLHSEYEQGLSLGGLIECGDYSE